MVCRLPKNEIPYSASVSTQPLQGIQPSEKQGIFITFVK